MGVASEIRCHNKNYEWCQMVCTRLEVCLCWQTTPTMLGISWTQVTDLASLASSSGWALLEKSGPGWALLERSGPGWALLERSGPGWALLERSGPGGHY